MHKYFNLIFMHLFICIFEVLGVRLWFASFAPLRITALDPIAKKKIYAPVDCKIILPITREQMSADQWTVCHLQIFLKA